MLAIVRATLDRLDEVEPLWLALHAHDAVVGAPVAPVRPPAESWSRRRAQYAEWLTSGLPCCCWPRRSSPRVTWCSESKTGRQPGRSGIASRRSRLCQSCHRPEAVAWG